MDIHKLTRELHTKNDTKIVMYVADGLGGLPQQPGGLTELETAKTPNLDALAKAGVLGSSIPVLPGISPGSGFELKDGDVAIRANFCTVDRKGNIPDRRAGRIPSEESAPLAIRLRDVMIPGIEIFVEPVKEHRFVIVLR